MSARRERIERRVVSTLVVVTLLVGVALLWWSRHYALIAWPFIAWVMYWNAVMGVAIHDSSCRRETRLVEQGDDS